MEVSNRSSDAFENEGKRAYRARHLEVLRDQAPELWTDEPPGRLRGAWLELMGSTGWRTLELLTDAAVLSPSSFVGADLDHDRIDDYRRRYPDARWLAGDVLDHVESPELDDVSVIHFDGYEAAGSVKFDHVGEQLAVVLRRAVARHGAAALLVNSDLDATRLHGQQPSAALRRHATTLAAVLAGAGIARREVTPEMLLPAGAENVVGDRAFVGLLGAFEVYKGKSTGHRMASCRAILR
jgi:hypothetical protein